MYQTEKLLREQGDGAPAEQRAQVDDALRSLKEALEGGDVSAIRSATEALSSATSLLTERLYQQAAEPQQPAGPAEPADDEVVDAEIVDERRSA